MSKPDQVPSGRDGVPNLIQRRIAELEQRLADLQARMPAHSMSPAMAMELERLEEAIEDLQKRVPRQGQEG